MKLLAIDGNNILFRAFYAIKLLSNKRGHFTNALTGFMSTYIRVMNEEKPDYVVTAFDMDAPTFRHKMYAEYKGTRNKAPDELIQQMPVIREMLKAMGVPVLETEGFEADDIIGTLSRAAAEKGMDCVILTGDRDSFQLINDRVTVRYPSTKGDVMYDTAKIAEVYGVTPREMLEVKALMGDSSDNIPGVKGVGEKTALALIQKYHSIEYIYANLGFLDVTKSVRAKLESDKDNALLSRKLGEIELHAPVDEDIEKYIVSGGDKQRAAELFTEMEMFSTMKKLGIEAVPIKNTAPVKAEKAPAKKNVVADKVDFDINAYDVILDGDIISAYKGGESYEGDIKQFLESDTPKRTVNAKALYYYCIKNGIQLKNVIFDTTLSAYLLNVNSNDYSVERLCAEYGVAYRADAMGQILLELNIILFSKLCEEGMYKILSEIEIPLAEVLSSMEIYGIAMDMEALHEFGETLLPQIASIEQEIYALAGREFNIGSPKQLSAVLFEELGLPAGKKSKSGGYSTNADTLEALRDMHPIIPLIFEYRTITKLYNTYIKGLENAVVYEGGRMSQGCHPERSKDAAPPSGSSRMHTTFKQTETRTGRISSAEPNIQNIPVRTELGRNFRKFFTASEGMVLVDADYSQIELRVLAHLADDKTMIEIFKSGGDIHAQTAASVFGQSIEEVDENMRRSAKAVNFGIVYGIGAFSLAKDIGTSVAEAKRYIESYLNTFSGVKEYMAHITDSAEEDGYAVTMFGRRRFIPEMLAANKVVKALGKRIAMNTPIQGTAADIIKIAMVKVYKRLKEELPTARLILQVHDELIVEVPEADSAKAAEILRSEMENAVKLSVPLTVDAKEGKTWYDAH